MIGSAAMQGIELRHTPVIETDHLGIKDGSTLAARSFLDNARITVRPIAAIHRVESHPPVADMDLQPIAVMLEFMRPAGFIRWTFSNRRSARGDEGGRRVFGPATRGLRIRHNMHRNIG